MILRRLSVISAKWNILKLSSSSDVFRVLSLPFFEHMKIRKTIGTENLLTRKHMKNAKQYKDLLKQTYHPKLSDTFWSGSKDGYQLQKSKKWGETVAK